MEVVHEIQLKHLESQDQRSSLLFVVDPPEQLPSDVLSLGQVWGEIEYLGHSSSWLFLSVLDTIWHIWSFLTRRCRSERTYGIHSKSLGKAVFSISISNSSRQPNQKKYTSKRSCTAGTPLVLPPKSWNYSRYFTFFMQLQYEFDIKHRQQHTTENAIKLYDIISLSFKLDLLQNYYF